MMLFGVETLEKGEDDVGVGVLDEGWVEGVRVGVGVIDCEELVGEVNIVVLLLSHSRA
jgi:hypothetical protein